MGCRIEGIGSNLLTIAGAKRLGGCEFALGAHVVEIGSFVGLAAATRGELTIENAPEENLRSLRVVFGRLGIRWERAGSAIVVPTAPRESG